MFLLHPNYRPRLEPPHVRRRAGRGAVLLSLAAASWLGLGLHTALAQTSADTAVKVSASVQKTPPKITLSWPANASATSATVYRKSPSATSWGTAVANLPGSATGYADTSVTVGTPYEYRVVSPGVAYAEGYVVAGIEVPLVESRGTVLLIVDATFTSSLASELDRLESDLVGDGWSVVRHDVARTETVPNVKELIRDDYARDPANVKYVFLFGHVPVPYAGAVAPDGHGNHYGAWPADMFYGDVDGVWTDSANYDSTVAGRQHNVAGDGKYDQSSAPSAIELGVGRVDLSNMPAFAPKTELDLLRQYLNKDHAFRHRQITAQRRGLIDDNFGYFGGEAFGGSGWRNFSAFFGASNVFALDWFTTLATSSYLWAYGCGGGNFTGAGGVGSTTNFVTTDTQAVFTMLFGSYFGDWDVANNFLRAPLATTTYGLTDAWSGRPVWHFHHMGMGEPVGYGALVTENNNGGLYMGSWGPAIHIALMGDPTLRMHIVPPPSSPSAVPSGGAATISWTASPGPLLGYNVYRSPSPRGPFTRVNGSLVTGTSFADAAAAAQPAGTYTWAVRAVGLESGEYFNASQAVFAEAAAGGGALTSDLSIRLDAPASASVSSAVSLRVRIESHGPADAAGVRWTATLPAGLAAASVAPSTGCTVAPTLVSCNVGALDRGVYQDFVVTATALTPGTATVVTSVSGTLHDPTASNDSASASVVVLASAPTTTVLASSLNPAIVGQSVTFTATVTSTSAGSPSGTIVFRDGASTIGTSALGAAGQATLATSSLAQGSRSITATYSGDAHFATSVSPAILQSIRATTTSTLSSNANPAIAGAAVVLTATVTSGSGQPTGNVSFTDGGTFIGSTTLDGAGHGTLVLTSLSVGTHSITASYGGDSSFNPSTSAALSQVIQAASGAATMTALVSSLNPSNFGQAVTLTATVSSATAGTIAGTVTFVSGSSLVGVVSVGAGGVAALTSTTLPAGSRIIYAAYSGSATFNPSRSANLTQTVRGPTTVAVTTSLNPAALTQRITFTATVSSPTFIGYPSGTMTFLDAGTTIGTGNVSLGRATFSLTTLPAGSHSISASYSGDVLFMPSVSPVIPQIVTGPQIFADVPPSSPYFSFVNILAADGITAGCGGGDFCPDAAVTRAQIATFLLRSKDGPTYVPPACSVPTFTDVPCSSGFAPWVDQLAARGITVGCGGGKYCPSLSVTRGQMAIFLLKTKGGSAYVPPACTTAPFTDVPCSSPYAIWIQELVHRGITAGCGTGRFCPDNAVTRGQMAVFLVTTFGLS